MTIKVLLADDHALVLEGLRALVDGEADLRVVGSTTDGSSVLDLVDRVLYLAPGGHRIGTPEEVLTSGSLSRLYGTRVDVVRVHGRVVVVGAPDGPDARPHHPQKLPETDGARR